MILMRPPAHVVASVRLAGCCLAYACLHGGGRPRACGSQNGMTMKRLLMIALLMAAAAVRAVAQPYLGERLGRGMVGIWSGSAMFLSWRMLPTDPDTMAFDVYRSAGGREVRLNSEPIVASSCFADSSAGACGPARWRLVSGGRTLAEWAVGAGEQPRPYISVPISRPRGGTVAGESYTYSANDCSVGDLDGDGEYEIVLKWSPSNSKRPPQRGFTGNTILDAYKLDGRRLWRIDLGVNIRSGECTTNFLVFDFDGDGRAELCCKTADGTVDGIGRAIGDPLADWRTHDEHSPTYGKIVRGPEYLTVFEGLTGRALSTAAYIPTRYPLDGWGGIGGNGGNDSTGGRSDRFTACVAFLDGKRPSPVMVRGWYGRTVVAAWTFDGDSLRSLWTFDSSVPGLERFSGMGNHNLSVADFDGDGCDEVCVGAMTVDNDGTGLYSTGLRHGDAMHVGRLVAGRSGLQVFGVHENEGRRVAYLQTPAVAMFDGATGRVIWQDGAGLDAGRGVAADIDPRYPGAECWCSVGGLRRGDTGQAISRSKPGPCSFIVYWDADPLSELLDRTTISKWDWQQERVRPLLEADGCVWINGSKGNPCLSADILGDWREEVVWPSADQKELRIYSTAIPAYSRRPSLMTDRQYRLSVAWQNVGYNQPPHLSFELK